MLNEDMYKVGEVREISADGIVAMKKSLSLEDNFS
jgi:hypothetical protein